MKQAIVVDTRVGNISLNGGYPSESTVERLFDEIDFQRAVQVYLWGLPAVSTQVGLAGFDRAYGPAPTTAAIFESFVDARTLMATANGQSVYARGALDLAQTGPVVLETPANVLGFLMSIWGTPLEDVGWLGPDAGRGGRYLVVPPGYREPLPDHGFSVRSDSYTVVWCMRGYAPDGNPAPAVRQLRQLRVYPLAEQTDPPRMSWVNASGRRAMLIPVGDDLTTIRYFRILADVVRREAAREKDGALLGMAASLGIRRGEPFAPDARMTRILNEAAMVGKAMAATQAFASRYPRKRLWPCRHWEELFHSEHAELESPYAVDLDAKTARFYQGLCASRRWRAGIEGVGAQAAAAFRDHGGEWLDGSRHYQLRVPANVPANDFWSVTVYDAVTRSMIDNEQQRAGVDSYRHLHTNADGSLDLAFGPSKRSRAESNWVQTIPDRGFFVYFRWYGPLKAYFDKSWQLPDLERL